MQQIFLGDVQGCAEELGELLDRADAEFGNAWRLWIVGDLINRGPDNLGSLRRVRARVDAGRAHYILGNHEIHLLATALGLRAISPWDSFADVLGAPDIDDWIDWLRKRPLVVRGSMGGQDFAMLHASTHPDWSLDELTRRAQRVAERLGGDLEDARRLLASTSDEDPDRDAMDRITCCRSIAPDGSWFSAPPDDGRTAWHADWSLRGHEFGVVYGHWALQGLHVAPWLRGLDTGCVHHGRGSERELTAWLPPPDRERPFDVPDRDFWQARARRAYYAHRDAGTK